MSEYEELKQLATDAYKAGKYDIATKAMDKMEAMQQQQPEQYDLPPMDDISSLPTQRPALSFKDRVVQRADQIRRDTMGGIEGMASMMTAMPATTIGQFSGGIQAIARPNNPLAGPESRDRVTSALTYQPKTPEGQQFVQGSAEAAENIIGPYVDAARLGDEALEAGLPEWVAKNAEGIPEFAGAVLAPLGMRNPQKPIIQKDKYGNVISGLKPKEVAKIDLLNNPEKATTAPYKLSGDKIVNHPIAKAALGQGWKDTVVSGTKAANPPTKSAIRKMIDIEIKRLTAGAEFKAKNRPSDVLGDNVFARYQFLENANKSAGKLMRKIAADQGKAPIDISGPINWFENKLSKLGVKVKDGKLDFSESTLLKSDRGLLQENYNQIRLATDKNVDFLAAHELKQRIRKVGLNYEPTIAKKGASTEAQDLFKGLSSRIDKILDTKSKAYDAQNIKYRDTVGLKQKFQKIEKSLQEQGHLPSDSSSDNLGMLMRRLTSNAVSRGAIKDLIENTDTVARKYGGKFDDNVYLQQDVINNIDTLIEPTAQTSIMGELGSKAMESAQRSTLANVTTMAKEMESKVGILSPEKALGSLRGLTLD